MPPRNNPLPAAVRLFNCAICDKGYPRQLDYENHLGSYDHNHRQRLADMKKLTASNDPESSKPKQALDMRSINIEDANKKPNIGGRFTKIGGGTAAGGSRFKKVGVAVGGSGEAEKKKEEEAKIAKVDSKPVEQEAKAPSIEKQVPEKTTESKTSEDKVMMEGAEQEAVTWEEYDFTKPTGCDHANCSGCKTEGIWSGEWLPVATI